MSDDIDYRAKLKERFAKARAELERRRHTRIDAKIPVAFASEDEFIKVYTENISKGGIYFETTERLSPNGRLELALSPPGSEKDVKVIGRVSRMITRYDDVNGKRTRVYGYGVRFEAMPPAQQKILDRFVKQALKEGAVESTGS